MKDGARGSPMATSAAKPCQAFDRAGRCETPVPILECGLAATAIPHSLFHITPTSCLLTKNTQTDFAFGLGYFFI